MKSHESSHLFLAQLPLVMGLLDEQMVVVAKPWLRQRKKTKKRQFNYYSLFYE